MIKILPHSLKKIITFYLLCVWESENACRSHRTTCADWFFFTMWFRELNSSLVAGTFTGELSHQFYSIFNVVMQNHQVPHCNFNYIYQWTYLLYVKNTTVCFSKKFQEITVMTSRSTGRRKLSFTAPQNSMSLDTFSEARTIRSLLNPLSTKG